MAKLTDEEKVKAFEGGGVDATADETPEEESKPDEEEASQEVETAKEETNSDETEETPEPLTKPFPWLKGDKPEEWVEELKVAYENSTNEALRLNEVLKTQPTAQAAETPPPTTTQVDPNAAVIAQMQAYLQGQTIEAFDKFAKSYPQAREPGEFDKFTKASNGAYQALTDVLGRAPSNAELFENIAKFLNWQPSDKTARKDAALKDATASSSTVSTGKTVKSTNVTEEELRVAERFFPHQSREDIIKGLAQVKNS